MARDEPQFKRAAGRLRLAADAGSSPAPDVPELSGPTEALLAGAPDGIAVVDVTGTVVAWNPAAERLFGIERQLAVGGELASLIFPEHIREAVRGVLRRQLTEGDQALGGRPLELGAKRANGREIPVDVATARIDDSGSGLLAVYLRDASERSDRERELHADARRRSAVLDLGQVALEGMDLDALLEAAVGLAIEELGVDRCEIWKRLDHVEELELRAGAGWPAEEARRHIPLSTANQPGYTLLRSQGAVVVEDFRREGRFAAVKPAEAPPVQSAISTRIPGGGSGFGSFVVAQSAPRRFDLSDISMIESLAQLLGAAIERTEVSDSLADAERRVRTLIERLPSIIYRAGLGARGRWEFISPQIEEVLGFTVDEWLGDQFCWEQCLHPDDLDWVLAEEERCAAENRPLDIEYRMRARDGRLIWVRDRASIGVRDEDGVMVVEGLLTDVTDQKAAEERLRFLTDHDELTGLLNRRGFEAKTEEVIATDGLPDGRGALLVIDLDHLKRVNDSLGRSTGDRVIAEVAKLLGDSLGPDDVFGRLDSDGFGLLVPGVGESQALERAGQLLTKIRSRPGAATLTASAGVALVERDMGISVADLLTAADIALHQAKEAGRDRAVLFTGEDRGRLEWVGHVRKTIEDEQLVLYSQPIIDLVTGLPHSEELLARMVDPTTGRPVAAGEFVPTAERFGLIRNLDRWVVARALDLVVQGRRVSANISAASIGDTELTEQMAEGIAKSGVDPSLLTFEITETAATPAIESLRDFTTRVERLGCGLSLDDVGTGFGSLTYLRHLPFTELKIDMQFIRGMLDSKADARIVESLVDIARGLGMRTVAEGVENPALIEPLRKLGIDGGQGYLFGRPAPVDVARGGTGPAGGNA